jgi:hypothetical protein
MADLVDEIRLVDEMKPGDCKPWSYKFNPGFEETRNAQLLQFATLSRTHRRLMS